MKQLLRTTSLFALMIAPSLALAQAKSPAKPPARAKAPAAKAPAKLPAAKAPALPPPPPAAAPVTEPPAPAPPPEPPRVVAKPQAIVAPLPSNDVPPSGDKPTEPKADGKSDRGAFVIGGKIGALASINGLSPHVTGAVQIGYIFPWFKRQLGLMIDVGYAQPVTSKTENDPRVQGGTYSWHLIEQQLTIQPSVYYRATMLPEVGPGKFVPYAGVGPRIFLTKSKTDSDGASPTLLVQNETSTEIGVGAHLGVEYLIGPGGLLVEGLFGWAKVKKQTTGDANLGAISAWAGYRFML